MSHIARKMPVCQFNTNWAVYVNSDRNVITFGSDIMLETLMEEEFKAMIYYSD